MGILRAKSGPHSARAHTSTSLKSSSFTCAKSTNSELKHANVCKFEGSTGSSMQSASRCGSPRAHVSMSGSTVGEDFTRWSSSINSPGYALSSAWAISAAMALSVSMIGMQPFRFRSEKWGNCQLLLPGRVLAHCVAHGNSRVWLGLRVKAA
jgi:hypothetical protein